MKPFRLGLSGSSFVYAMSHELLMAAHWSIQTERPVRFDDRMNSMMVDFMREMMRVMSTTEIDCMECYHSIAWDRDRILDVILDEPGVEFWSVHAPYGAYLDPSSPDPEIRKCAVDACLDAVKVAARLGAKVIVTHPGAHANYDSPREPRPGFAAETLKRVADAAGEIGVCIAVEPLPKDEVGNTLDEVLRIIEMIDRPNVGVNFDVNHLYPPEAIPGLIRRAGELILSVHISDQDGIERHWLPFAGAIDWKEVLAALADAGYRGPLVYETHIRDAKSCEEVGRAVVENYKRLIALAP